MKETHSGVTIRWLLGSAVAGMILAVALTAFLRGNTPIRDRVDQAGITAPATTGSIAAKRD